MFRVVETGRQRRPLAEAAAEAMDAFVRRCCLGDLVPGSASAAVVDDHGLVVNRDGSRDDGDLGDELAYGDALV